MGFFERIGNIISTYYKWILKGVGYTMLVAIVGTIVGLLIGVLIGMYRTLDTPKNKFLAVLKKSVTSSCRRTSRYSAARL